jgi:hypothetical protein
MAVDSLLALLYDETTFTQFQVSLYVIVAAALLNLVRTKLQ